ncbi:class I adenylate-forming enzyme family protein [Saccharopolyspora cebuensis]|uniref:Class I adenylate-forming enzyme family protein n=1 Tax=Saccharopolyspora cebuensis TaxID=418759 RepID=A0ABV4CDC7_9PSEU
MSHHDDLPRPADITPEFGSALEMWEAAVAAAPDRTAVHYFDGRLDYAAVDELADAFACALLDGGLTAGDRVALYLQNVPQFVIGLVGTWKAGCIAVPVNPMNRQRELDLVLRDSGARALLCLEGLHESVAAEVVPDTDVVLTITTSEREHQTRDDPRAFPEPRRRPGGSGGEVPDMAELVARYRGSAPPRARLGPDDVAVLTYTSGTTGPPKGAMNTHRNVVFNARTYRDWIELGPDDVVLGVAPLFHITGLIGHVALAMLLPAPLVLVHRFHPEVVADAVRDSGATFTVGAITAFIALLNAPGVDPADPATLTKVYSGGAPIPPSTTRAFEERFGHYVHNVYGLTETTSPALGVPLRARAPVDPGSGALAVGVPVHGTLARIVDDDGAEAPPGEVGELVVSGPQVVPGYWGKPAETEHALPGGALRTGDVARRDADGWFYLVDRKKDQINAGGFKVWPREVEDVLYEHDAVREAAVVGVADGYRGETVKAFVSLRPGHHADPEELIAFCRARMAAYKYPRQVEVLDELPKTTTGKLLRRALRERPGA